MTILSNNLKRIFGKPINIVFLLVVPILLNIIFIAVSASSNVYVVGVFDNDKTKLTKQFIKDLDVDCDIVTITKDELSAKVINSEVNCALVFDKGFTDDIIDGKDVFVKNYSLEGSNVSEPVTMYISSYMSAIKTIGKASSGDEDLFYQGMNRYYEKEFSTKYTNFEFSITEEVDRAVQSLGYIAMGMMFLLSAATALILEDKMWRVFDRIRTTPIKMSSYFIQHLLSYVLVAFIQIIAMVIIIPNVVDISFGDHVVELIVVCMVFAISCISIGIVISRYAKNSLSADAAIGLINLPFLMLGGCLWPRELMPDTLQRIGDFVPTTWFLKASETVLYGNGLMDAAPQLIYLFILTVVMIILAFAIKVDKAK